MNGFWYDFDFGFTVHQSDGSAWRHVADAAAKIPMYAIVNPNSGPGEAQDSEYVTGIELLKGAGVKVKLALTLTVVWRHLLEEPLLIASISLTLDVRKGKNGSLRPY